MADYQESRTFYDVLRERAILGNGGAEPVIVKRTVYGTSDSKAYQCSDGAFYRVRKERANGN